MGASKECQPSLFVTCIYIRYWFQAPSPTIAPKSGQALQCSLSLYPQTNIADAAVTAFGSHIWYLAALLLSQSFFHNDVSMEGKMLLVLSIRDKNGSEEPPKRISLSFTHAQKDYVHVTKTVLRLFLILELSDVFMEDDSRKYNQMLRITQGNLQIYQSVNNLTEHIVTLIQSFNAVTRNEDKNNLPGKSLQIVLSTTKKGTAKQSRAQ